MHRASPTNCHVPRGGRLRVEIAMSLSIASVSVPTGMQRTNVLIWRIAILSPLLLPLIVLLTVIVSSLAIATNGSSGYRATVRIRLPELLKERDLSPYELSKQSNGRISMSTAYRIVRKSGRLKTFDAETLEVLCEILRVLPGDLLERETDGEFRYPAPPGERLMRVAEGTPKYSAKPPAKKKRKK